MENAGVLQSKEDMAVQLFLDKGEHFPQIACDCLGRQDGQPDCPCGMFWYVEVDGEYFYIKTVTNILGNTKSTSYTAENVGSGPFPVE